MKKTEVIGTIVNNTISSDFLRSFSNHFLQARRIENYIMFLSYSIGYVHGPLYTIVRREVALHSPLF
jgi:hypothetical protein